MGKRSKQSKKETFNSATFGGHVWQSLTKVSDQTGPLGGSTNPYKYSKITPTNHFLFDRLVFKVMYFGDFSFLEMGNLCCILCPTIGSTLCHLT